MALEVPTTEGAPEEAPPRIPLTVAPQGGVGTGAVQPPPVQADMSEIPDEPELGDQVAPKPRQVPSFSKPHTPTKTDWSYIRAEENVDDINVARIGHWPGGESGVTASYGVDLRYRTKASMIKDGVEPELAAYLASFAGLSGKDAEREAPKLKLTPDQAIHLAEVYEGVHERAVPPEFKEITGKSFYNLTPEAQTVLMSLAYNHGSLASIMKEKEDENGDFYRPPSEIVRQIAEGDTWAAIQNLRNFGGNPELQERRSREADYLERGFYEDSNDWVDFASLQKDVSIEEEEEEEEIEEVSQSSKIPTETLKADPALLKQIKAQQLLDRVLGSPAAVKVAKNPKHAPIIKLNIDKVVAMEARLREIRGTLDADSPYPFVLNGNVIGEKDVFQRYSHLFLVNPVLSFTGDALDNMSEMAAEAYRAPWNATKYIAKQLGADEFVKEIDKFVTPSWWKDPTKTFEEGGDWMAKQYNTLAKDYEVKNKSFGEQVGAGTSYVAMQLVTGMVYGKATQFFQMAGAGWGESKQATLESMHKSGVKPDAESQLLANMIGALSVGVTEKIGLGLLIDKMPAKVKNYLVRVTAGAAIEFTQELMQKLAITATQMGLIDPKAAERLSFGDLGVSAAVGGVIAALIPGKGGGPIQFGKDIVNTLTPNSAKRQAKLKVQLDAFAAETQLFAKVNKEVAGEVGKEALAGQNIESVLVAPEAIITLSKESADPAQYLEDLGIADQMQAALENNTPVSIDALPFATHILTAPNFSDVSVHMQLKDSMPTVVETVKGYQFWRDSALVAMEEEQGLVEEGKKADLKKLLKSLKSDGEIDAQAIIDKTDSSTLNVLDDLIKKISKREGATEQALKEGRLNAIEEDRIKVEEKIVAEIDKVEKREAEGKSVVANLKRAEILFQQLEILDIRQAALEIPDRVAALRPEFAVPPTKAQLKKGIITDENSNPLIVYRGSMGGREGVSQDAIEGKPREGYATFLTPSTHVANTWGQLSQHPDVAINESAATAPFYIQAKKVIEFPVKETKTSTGKVYRQLDFFAFDEAAQNLKPGEVLVARAVRDRGPRADPNTDPDNIAEQPQDVYAVSDNTTLISAISGKATDPNPAAPKPSDRITTKAKVFEQLKKVEAREAKQAVRTAAREATRATKRNVKEGQGLLRKMINESELTNEEKSHFITDITETLNPEQLARKIPRIQKKVLETVEKRKIKKASEMVTDLVNKYAKPKKAVSLTKESNGLDVDTFEIFQQLKADQKLSKTDALEKMFMLDIKQISGETLTDLEQLQRTVLAIRAGSPSINASSLEADIITMAELIADGKAITLRKSQQEAKVVREKTERLVAALPTTQFHDKNSIQQLLQSVENQALLTPTMAWSEILTKAMGTSDMKEALVVLNDLDLFESSLQRAAMSERRSINFLEKMAEAMGVKQSKVISKLSHDNRAKIWLGGKGQTWVHADGSEKTIVMTKGQMRQLSMEMSEPDLWIQMQQEDAEGYTFQIKAAIDQELNNAEDQAIMDAMKEMYTEYYEDINEVYKDVYGINLNRRGNYVPTSYESSSKDLAQDTFMKDIHFRGALVPGSVKERKGSGRRRTMMSDYDTFRKYQTEMEYFMAYGKQTRQLNAIFDHKTMSKIQDVWGPGFKSVVTKLLINFNNKGAVEASNSDSIVRIGLRNFGISTLGLKPTITMKQWVSAAAFMEDVNGFHFMEGLAQYVADPKAAKEVLGKSLFYQLRGNAIDPDMSAIVNSRSKFNFLGNNPKLADLVMMNIKYGDKTAINAGGFAMVYALKKAGMSEPDALRAFAKKANQTQQSNYIEELSEWQANSNLMYRALSQFQSSGAAIVRQEYKAIINRKRERISRKEFAKKMLIYHVAIPQALQIISNLGWDTGDQAMAFGLGSLNNLIVAGAFFQSVVAGFSNMFIEEEDDKFDLFSPAVRYPFEAFANTLKLFTADDWDDVGSIESFIEGNKALKAIAATAGGFTGAPALYVQRFLEGLFGIATQEEGMFERSPEDKDAAFRKMLGYSNRAIKKQQERNEEEFK